MTTSAILETPAVKLKTGVKAVFTYAEKNLASTSFVCHFCGRKINLEDALRDDFSLWSTVSSMCKLADWRKKMNDLYGKARKGKIMLNKFYVEKAKLMRELQKAEQQHSIAPTSYSGGFEARCKKCKRLHTIGLSLKLDAERFPEEPSTEEKMQLKVSKEALLRIAEKLHYPNVEAYKEWFEGQKQTELNGAVEKFVSEHLENADYVEAKELKRMLQGFVEKVNRELRRRKVKFLNHVYDFARENLPKM